MVKRLSHAVEALLAISVAAGFVGAMGGLGGGIVVIPALTLLGIDIKHAIATCREFEIR